MFAKERLYLKTVNSKLSLKEEELTRGHDGQQKRRVDQLLVPGWTKGLEKRCSGGGRPKGLCLELKRWRPKKRPRSGRRGGAERSWRLSGVRSPRLAVRAERWAGAHAAGAETMSSGRRLRSSVPRGRQTCASGARRESLLLTYTNRAPSPTPQFLLLG